MNVSELLSLLKAVYALRDGELRREFKRSLPWGETIVDRWERARQLGFGEGASIYGSAYVYGDVSVGERTWIGPNVILDGSGGGVDIGSFCEIAAGVHIYTHDTARRAVSGGIAAPRQAPVSIGSRCYVGSQSVITPGVRLGERCVVGANSFVNRDVEAASIVVGTPARVVGRVTGQGADVALVFERDGDEVTGS